MQRHFDRRPGAVKLVVASGVLRRLSSIDRNPVTPIDDRLQEAFELARRLGFTSRLAHGLEVCAALAARAGQPERAARLVRAIDEQLGAIGARPSRHGRTLRAETMATVTAALTDAQLTVANEEGRMMSLDDALAYGLEAVRSAAGRASPASG